MGHSADVAVGVGVGVGVGAGEGVGVGVGFDAGEGVALGAGVGAAAGVSVAFVLEPPPQADKISAVANELISKVFFVNDMTVPNEVLTEFCAIAQ